MDRQESSSEQETTKMYGAKASSNKYVSNFYWNVAIASEDIQDSKDFLVYVKHHVCIKNWIFLQLHIKNASK